MSQRNNNYCGHKKQEIKALYYSLLEEAVHTSSAIVAAVRLTSNANISPVGSLLANTASGVAETHISAAARLLQFRLCKAQVSKISNCMKLTFPYYRELFKMKKAKKKLANSLEVSLSLNK